MRTRTHHRGSRVNRRAIGIDITPYCIRALQITRQEEQWCIEKAFSVPTQRCSDTSTSILEQLTENFGFDRRAHVAVAMPYNTVFYRDVKTDNLGATSFRQADMSDFINDFPIPANLMITQICNERTLPQSGSSRLVAATDRDSVQERLGRLSDLQITPRLVESEIFALRAAALANYPEMRQGLYAIAYVDQCHLSLVVLQDAQVLAVRNTPIVLRTKRQADVSREQQEAEFISHELRLTWEKVFQESIDYNTQVVIATDHKFSNGLVAYMEEELRCPTRLFDPCSQIQCPHGLKVGHDMVIAVGLAIRMFAPESIEGVNFLTGLQTNDKSPINVRKELSVCGSLLLGLMLVWGIGLMTELSSLESKYSSIKADIERAFRLAAPDEGKIINPVVQLTQKIKALEQSQQRFSPYRIAQDPLTVMQRVSTSKPHGSHIEVISLLIAGESVSIQATCTSFDEAYQWQRQLERTAGFTGVEIQMPQMDSKSGVVKFKVVLSLEMA